jgi:nucleotide-binding universal stress UspA family protein
MIVIGSRGLSQIKELLLGSVSHSITKHADIPILVVK